jgi:tetratricopeptide (TPR) repeat protein
MALMIHHFAQEQLQEAEAACCWNPTALRSELERLLQTYPDFPPALDRLASVLEEAGQPQSALPYRIRAAKNDPENADVWARLASLQHSRLGQTGPALQSLKHALTIDPGHRAASDLLTAIERTAHRRPA